MERYVKMILLCVCLVVPGSGQQGGGVLVCPTSWNIDSAVKLTFFIDEARFPSKCNLTDNRPFFQMSRSNSLNYQTNCTVSDIAAQGACDGSFTPSSLGCGCTSKKGGYYFVQYNFIAHPDYNGWWSAGIACRDSRENEVLSFETVNCANKEVNSRQDKADGVLVCPRRWILDNLVKLTFILDLDRFPSECNHTDNRPFFQMSRSNNYRTNCTVLDITAPGACNGSFTSGSLDCGCTSKNGGYYVMEYNFIAHPDYDGWWTAGIACRNSQAKEVLSFTTVNCANKTAHSSASNTGNDANIVTLVVGILTFGTSTTANDVKVVALLIGILTFGL